MRTFLVLTLSAILLAITTAAHKPVLRRAPACNHPSPVLVGRITLGAGVGQVNHPYIHAGMIVIFSVNSPDSLSAGARVSVYTIDEGILVFWAHLFDAQGSNQTTDEPEVHFSVWNSNGPGTFP